MAVSDKVTHGSTNKGFIYSCADSRVVGRVFAGPCVAECVVLL